MSNIFKLTIDANAMGFEKQATHARIVNQYVDVNDSMRITAPIDRYLTLSDGLAVVDVVPTTAGSIYQIILMNCGESLLDAYFTMPASHTSLSQLELHTAYPTRSNHPSDLVTWGFIQGDIGDQLDLSGLVFTQAEATALARKVNDVTASVFTKAQAITLKEDVNHLVAQERAELARQIDVKAAQTKDSYLKADVVLQEQIDSIGGGKFAYKTYIKMEEAAALPPKNPLKLPPNSSIDITNDPDASKNGSYSYDGFFFTRSNYDVKNTVLNKVYEFVDRYFQVADEVSSNSENLVDFADLAGSVYMAVDNYGALKLSGLSDDVQTMINNTVLDVAELDIGLSAVKKESGDTAKLVKSKTDGYSSNLVEMTDVDDKTYLIVDSMGGLKLSGLQDSAQTMLLKSANTTKKLDATTDISGAKSFALMLVDDNDKLIFGVKNDGKLLTNEKPPLSIKRPYYLRPTTNLHNSLQQVSAPVPTNHVPMDFDVPSSILNLTITQPTPCVVDTIYYQDDGVVHPTVLDFYSGFNGYQYWLGITPYHLNDDLFENPFIYVSDDLKNFKQNTDFAQPMADQPQARDGSSGYNSDIFYTYDFQSNELLVCWRTSRRGTESGSVLSARRTRDGVNWSDAEVIYAGQAGESILSPSIVYDHVAKKYLMFCIDSESAGLWGISRYESNSLNGVWTNKTYGVLDRSVASPWHLDVRYVGRQLVGILNDDRVTNQLYMVISNDMGLNWDIGVPMITGAQDHAYKATFTPIYDGNQMALQVMWTSNQSATNPDKRWRLFSTKTNFVTISGV